MSFFQTTGMWLLMILPLFFFLYIVAHRNETADAYMRLYSEDNKRVTEAVYGRKYKLRVGVNNLDSKLFSFFLFLKKKIRFCSFSFCFLFLILLLSLVSIFFFSILGGLARSVCPPEFLFFSNSSTNELQQHVTCTIH